VPFPLNPHNTPATIHQEQPTMVSRQDIIWLGVSAGVTGGLTGGLLLGIGLGMVVNGIYGGFIFIIPGAPASGLIGWLLARKLAKQL
jgi:predicted lipid-binding transport protein (Tim44 family)